MSIDLDELQKETETRTILKSNVEDAIAGAAKALEAANAECIRLKKVIGDLALDYKLLCDHGEYMDLVDNLGVTCRTILRWRHAARRGETTNSGTLYRKAKKL